MPATTYSQTSALFPDDLEAKRNARRHVEAGLPRLQDARSEARRDRDRLWYATSFQRLKGVTQVVTPSNRGMVLHDRLTHSLKVSQIARSIAENLLVEAENRKLILELGGLDANATEACALAHDLGHPPFGHIGEEVFDSICRERLGLVDGFEGNAQTFRIIAKLEVRALTYPGLDLTRATRAGVLKYPWTRIPLKTTADDEKKSQADRKYRLRSRKFGFYRSEAKEFEDARSFLAGTGILTDSQSLEASVMDLADDITYAIHDLEDFYQARFVDVPQILEEFRRHGDGESLIFAALETKLANDYVEYFDASIFAKSIERVGKAIHETLGPTGFDGSRKRIGGLKKWTADRIGDYVNAVKLVEQPLWPGGGNLTLSQSEWHEIQVYKELTRTFVIQRVELAVVQRAQQALLESLFDMIASWRHDEGASSRLPRALREHIQMTEEDENERGAIGDRAIIDFLCRLTDDQCTSLHQGLTGLSLQGVADRFII